MEHYVLIGDSGVVNTCLSVPKSQENIVKIETSTGFDLGSPGKQWEGCGWQYREDIIFPPHTHTHHELCKMSQFSKWRVLLRFMVCVTPQTIHQDNLPFSWFVPIPVTSSILQNSWSFGGSARENVWKKLGVEMMLQSVIGNCHFL